jgi:hypothetical protein
MLTVNKKPYIVLDHLLPLDSLPDLTEAITDSYDLIHWNCYGRTKSLSGEQINDNWIALQNRLPLKYSGSKGFWELEVRNKTRACYYVLDLTTGHDPSLIVYDSHDTPIETWNNIKWREDLPETWKPLIEWANKLDVFDKLGRVCLLITRPGIPVEYHRDTGQDRNDDFAAFPHRQEFFWLNLDKEKTLYILDDDRNPIKFECRSAFFNHHNWHGSHDSLQYWNFSLKFEGIFNQSFRERAGFGHINKYYYEE